MYHILSSSMTISTKSPKLPLWVINCEPACSVRSQVRGILGTSTMLRSSSRFLALPWIVTKDIEELEAVAVYGGVQF